MNAGFADQSVKPLRHYTEVWQVQESNLLSVGYEPTMILRFTPLRRSLQMAEVGFEPTTFTL